MSTHQASPGSAGQAQKANRHKVSHEPPEGLKPIHITIPGNPVAQARPRFGNGHAYDDTKSRNYKALVRLSAKAQMKRQGAEISKGAIWLSLQVYREIPKSWSEKRKQAAHEGKILPETRPDTSNYLKGIEDALNGICWQDDSAIVEYREPFGKWYSLEPRIEITFGSVEERVKK